MASKAQRIGNVKPQAASSQKETREGLTRNSARDEEISRRAYEVYLERGERPGNELGDWLQAEREIESRARVRAQTG